ncbi:hypothetical protein PFISCL1PPCAC_17215, partial [Pristionchus fissidentatus]
LHFISNDRAKNIQLFDYSNLLYNNSGNFLQFGLGVGLLEDVGELLEHHDVALCLGLTRHECLNWVQFARCQLDENGVFHSDRHGWLGAIARFTLVDIAWGRLEVHRPLAHGLAVLENFIQNDAVDLLEVGPVARQLLLDGLEENGRQNIIGHG